MHKEYLQTNDIWKKPIKEGLALKVQFSSYIEWGPMKK
jgi:hypothetical protein